MTLWGQLDDLEDLRTATCCDAPSPREGPTGWFCSTCSARIDGDIVAMATCIHSSTEDLDGHVVCINCKATSCAHPENVPCRLATAVTRWRWSP